MTLRHPPLLAAGVGGLVLTASAVTLTLATAPAHHRAFAACAYGLLVAVPFAVALTVLARRPRDRFAWLLLGAGAVWATVTLTGSSDPVLHSLGRIALWLAEPVLIYLLLAFPSGRLTSRAEKRVATAAWVLALTLFVPSALVHAFPVPGAGATCGSHCPDNAFMLAGSDWGVVGSVVRPVRETLLVALYVAIAVLLIRRARRAGPLLRRALVPAMAAAVVRVLITLGFLVVRAGDPDAAGLEALGWAYVLTLPFMALGFGAGLVVRQLQAAGALERLAENLRGHADGAALRSALADALEDPSLQMVFWRPGEPGQWVDENGWPVAAPHASPTTAVTRVDADGQRVAAIVHDRMLAQDPALMHAAGSYALAVLENSGLVGRLRTALGELSRSRSRVVGVGDEVRREIERDLHDGAQQRLVALRIELALQSERLEASDPETAALLAGLGDEVETTIDQVRALARGIYPPLLTEQGLGAALRAVARTSPVPATVELDGVERLPAALESTVYFVCLEALQNVAKHAPAAHHVAISVRADPELRVEISDDGDGFAMNGDGDGHGLTNLRDRLWAVGGELEVDSHPGHGTRVVGTVPLAREAT